MKTIKRLLALVPAFAVWLIACVLLWGFVFTRITDAPAEQKIVICVDAPVENATGLAVELENRLGGRIRMVQVRPFTYAMFDGDALRKADLFIVPASHVETYREWFTKDPPGIPAYDAQTGQGIAVRHIQYALPDAENENYYLFLGAASCHNGEKDTLAQETAIILQQIP